MSIGRVTNVESSWLHEHSSRKLSLTALHISARFFTFPFTTEALLARLSVLSSALIPAWPGTKTNVPYRSLQPRLYSSHYLNTHPHWTLWGMFTESQNTSILQTLSLNPFNRLSDCHGKYGFSLTQGLTSMMMKRKDRWKFTSKTVYSSLGLRLPNHTPFE